MSNAQFASAPYRQTLFAGLLEAANKNGGDHVVVENYDENGTKVGFDYNKLLAGSDILGRKIKDLTNEKERIGMLLPNSAGAVVTFFALQRFGRIPAILNPIAGVHQAIACAKAAQLKNILTSRLFLSKMEEKKQPALQEIITAFEEQGMNIIFLEDIKADLSKADQLAGLVRANAWHEKVSPDDPAVVIFTSGSESLPKGVVLSHANLMANRYQMKAVVDFNPSDTILNAMPMFHSFGLLAGTLLPILEGIKTFMYPDPKDFRMIPNVSYDVNATIIFGTDKFLSGYARQAHAYHFKTLRAAFAGAEKLEDTTRRIWADKLGVRVLEGYGATETAPVISACTPMNPVPNSLYKASNDITPNTVGKMVPGMEYKLEAFADHDGETSGNLIVKGPNVMLGYLKHDNPGVIQSPEDGWYNTGDIVRIDDEGFISIIGRAKRFAKIGGEMVPLPQVDDMATKLWEGYTHVACTFKVDTKEIVVLVTDYPDADLKPLREYAKENSIPMIFVPSQVIHVDEIPLLATGKIAFGDVDAMVEKTFNL
jgi:acyl-[acyl-carrier-protein]-phospholipid O-acyltransferase/long-chain-fatty-acid--[acyl-carrier-protein] ligase